MPLDADSDTATSRSPTSTSPVTLGDEIVSELLAVLPRLVERTQAQFGFIRAVAAKLGCNASNRTDDRSPAGPTLRIVTDADLPPATQVVATQATAKKAPAKKAPARKAPAGKTPAKKAPAERTPAKKAPAKKAPAKTAPAKKRAAKQAPARTPRAASSVVAPPPTAAPSVDELGISAYDSLAASQVIPRLDSLSGVELDAVRRYEIAGRGRRTILTRVAQLQAG